MKTTTWLLLGGGAYALYYLGNVGAATGTVQVIFQGVQIRSLTNYIVTFTVQNIANVSVDVNALTGSLFLNGNEIANLSDFTARTVPAKGQVNIDVEVSPELLSLPAAIQSLVNGSGETLNFTVQGNVNVSGLILPFTLDKSIQI